MLFNTFSSAKAFKLCYDYSGFKKSNPYFISRISSVPVPSDHHFEHFTFTAEFYSSKDLKWLYVSLSVESLERTPVWHTDAQIAEPSFALFYTQRGEWNGAGEEDYFLSWISACTFYLAF